GECQWDVLSDPSDRLRYLSATLTVIWQDRLTMRSARPLARGMMRFSERPSLTKTVETFRSSTSAPSLCSALATADSSTFFSSSAAFLLLKANRLSASPTFFPRIWSATKRAFWAEIRAPDSLAATSIFPYPLTLGFFVSHMPAIGAGSSELAEFVADHVFVHENRDMLATVMHGDGQTDHLRQNHRTARPGFHRLAIILFHRHFDLLQ